MGHAYTPGLQVVAGATLRRRRLLPIPGEVCVGVGDRVSARDAVARTQLPGKVHSVNVANRMGIAADEVRHFMVKKEGDAIGVGEALAENKPFFKRFKTSVTSPIAGRVESVSEITGQVLLREPPRALELAAYVDGVVVEVLAGHGVVVETEGAFIQGIFGVGGETHGELSLAVKSPEEILSPAALTEDCRGKIVVGGAYASWETLLKAKEVGVRGVVVGGIDDKDLRALLGYDIGVAVTGAEDLGFTLILTEGFGAIPMAVHTFGLLESRRGEPASLSGATQIRAGVLRPEIIVPRTAKPEASARKAEPPGPMRVGDPVRLIREPYFGRLGRITSLPAELVRIATESEVRVLGVSLDGQPELIVPRANVETLEK